MFWKFLANHHVTPGSPNNNIKSCKINKPTWRSWLSSWRDTQKSSQGLYTKKWLFSAKKLTLNFLVDVGVKNPWSSTSQKRFNGFTVEPMFQACAACSPNPWHGGVERLGGQRHGKWVVEGCIADRLLLPRTSSKASLVSGRPLGVPRLRKLVNLRGGCWKFDEWLEDYLFWMALLPVVSS